MPWTRARFTVEGQSFDEQKDNPVANLQNISPDYFRVMQIPLISGRFFDERDAPGAPRVAIISRRLAERFWPGEDPIGRRSEEHTSELQSLTNLVCRLLLE